jgi:LPXTG-motif cell wall-anchored protein
MMIIPSDRRGLIAGVMLLVLGLCGAKAGARPYVLVIEAAQDTSQAFRAIELLELERRALVWPEGMVSLPDTMAWLEAGSGSLAFELHPNDLVGFGAGGRFHVRPGTYDLDLPLMLADQQIIAVLTGGQLEIQDDQIVYRRPATGRDTRGDYFILGGLILATAVLLMAIRRRTSQARPSNRRSRGRRR